MFTLQMEYEWHIVDCYDRAIFYREKHEQNLEDTRYNGMYLLIAETYEKLAQDLEKLQGK